MIQRKVTYTIAVLVVIILSIGSKRMNESNVCSDINFRTKRNEYNWDAEVLKKALDADYVRWKNDPNVNTEYTGYGVLRTGKAMNYLALVAFYDNLNNYPEVSKRLVEHLQYVISGGKEPCCRGVIAGWADNSLAQSITLAKYTRSVWSKLSDSEKEKLDLLMKALAIAGNYCHNSQNSVHRGLYQAFNWRKGWNPNHQEGYVGVMVAAWIYFGGADAVNQVFKDFIFEDYMAQFTAFGFENIKSCWQSSGKELMENGGTDSGGGTTKGVRMPFRYSSLSGYGELDYDPYLLYRDLSARMYKHPVTSSGCDNKSFILDGSISPYEGQTGMCFEFKAVDASGCRSSARYCFEGWWNNIMTAASLQAFGLLPETAEKKELMDRLETGSSDLIYKLQHGYRDHKNGKSSDEYDKNLSGLGYIFTKDIYDKVVSVE
jgi:hypothetical protein